MPKRKFRIGDKVLVVQSPPIRFAKGVRDEIGTKKLFKYMVGKVYTVRGFEKDGCVELHPRLMDWVWIEPKFLKLRARRRDKTRSKPKR
jgi:hypothetical protein